MSSNLQKFNKTITAAQTQDYLLTVLGTKKNSFVNNLTALVSNNTKLQECEPVSLMYAGIKATALDLPLDPNLGFAYVIPYKNNKEGKTEAQFQIGYKGFIQLAIRTGWFEIINATDIRQGELVGHDLITGEINFQAAENREELPIIGYASFFRLKNGFRKYLYMSVKDIEGHAKRYSQSFASKFDNIRQSSKWATDFDAMALKTVLKLVLSKYAPLSIEMRDAIAADQAILEEGGMKYIDNNAEFADIENAVEVQKEDMREAAKTGTSTAPEMM